MISKTNFHLLVVDDESSVRNLLCEGLQRQGYRVTAAEDGREAIEKIKKGKFDLVITDVMMPSMNGIEMLEAIKGLHPTLEVILTSGNGQIETAVSAMKKGAYDFVKKPLHMEELYALVEKALQKTELKTLLGLYESSKAIFSTLKLQETLEAVMDLIQKVLQADEGSLMLLNEENKLYIASSRGTYTEAKAQMLKIGERVAGRAALDDRPFLIHGGLEQHPEFQGLKGNARIHSAIVFPLRCQDQILGVLNLNRTSQGKNFTEADLLNVSIFASHVSQAILNAKLYQELEAKIHEVEKRYRRLEESKDKLLQFEKMASIGRLAAGIAHEINNPLTAVIGYTQLLKDYGGLQGEAAHYLQVVAEESERCSKITQSLLAFARRRKIELKSVQPSQVLEEALGLVAYEIRKGDIQVEKKILSQCPVLQADADQLKEVFVHILSNACHALEEIQAPRKIMIEASIENASLRISFANNGPPFQEDHLDKIFDPFFTTKEIGRGMGLGLSLCYGILQQHGGRIFAHNRPQGGVAFVIELALSPADSGKPSAKAEVQGARADTRGSKKILVVEDEPTISSLLDKILSEKGHEVTKAGDGEVAIKKTQEEEFDLIISDFRLPKMDGRSFFQKYQATKPAHPSLFLFISGYDHDQELDYFFKENKLSFLQKPFSLEQLLTAIQNVLEGSS